MRGAVGIDGEGDTHLSGGNCQAFGGEKAGIGIQHLDLPFVREVDLGLVGNGGQYIAGEADAGIADFEASGTHSGLILIFGTDGSVNLRQVVFGFQIFFINFLSVFVTGRLLGIYGQWQ